MCVALFLLSRYWGIVTVPGSFLKAGDLGWPDPHPHLNYVAGYTGPPLFLFERTHNYSVDNQVCTLATPSCGQVQSSFGLIGESLSDGKITRARGPKVCVILHLPQLKATKLFLRK